MYLAGVSVRRVEDITEALWGTRVSPGTVSNLNKKIYARSHAGTAWTACVHASKNWALMISAGRFQEPSARAAARRREVEDRARRASFPASAAAACMVGFPPGHEHPRVGHA